jgi:transcription elongation factor Elf1
LSPKCLNPHPRLHGNRYRRRSANICGSGELEAAYGKFGYYFVCRRCEKNTAIKFTCPACGGEGRIRKAGKDFFAECKACDASALYHSNSALNLSGNDHFPASNGPC